MEEGSGRPTRRLRRVLLWTLLVVAGLILALWSARRPIATEVIDRRLRAAGVPARYEMRDLGLGRQRLVNVVIGDPARPDLVADWIETGTRIGWDGAGVTAIRAGRVRLRARVVGGRVSLGAIDRLLPAASGAPFALPRLFVDVEDARVRLETPAGVVGVRLSGRGRLDDGFDGRLAAVGARLGVGGCVAERLVAAVRVRVADRAPSIAGPVRAASFRCEQGGAERVAATVDAAFGPALDRWRGSARLTTGALAGSGARAVGLAGTVGFDGTAAATRGRADLALTGVGASSATARRVALAGDYRIGAGAAFAGRVRGEGVSVAAARLDARALAGTPLGPIADRLAAAVGDAVRSFDLDAEVAGDNRDGVRVAALSARSASGATLRLAGGDGVSWSRTGVRLGTEAALEGGGLPTMRVTLQQMAPGAPVRGVARVAAMAAGGASLSLTPVIFSAAVDGATRVETVTTLSGPIGDGRVDGLRMPLVARWDGRAGFAVNPTCAPASFDRLAVAGLTLSPTRLTLCPTGPALVRVDAGRVTGGARIDAPRIAGRLGSTPVTVTAGGAEVALGTRGFTLRDVAAKLGGEGRVTRIDAGRLDGRVEGGAVVGRFDRTGGQIASVPLLLSDAAGAWALRGGVLTLHGGATVADAAARRFEPLRSEDLRLRLADGRIGVTGALLHPATRARVADVRIAHDLSAGSGEALLDVAGVAFDEKLQPEALTRLTFGVVADVRGRVAGEGRIAWDAAGVTSTGAFRTEGLNFAAAFGPVTGLKGTIRFDDLLSLRSAPGQVAAVATINPGIPVTDGVVRYQTLPDARVRVEGGRWPFAGGTLTLEPALLDFSAPRERRMTFRVEAMAADQFLQQFDFANLNATGVFDGVLPMVFDERGGRIEGGRLRVRNAGGTLAYVGVLGQRELGTWGNLAFQALKSLRYRDLDIAMDGPLAGEMVTRVRFAGVSQGEGAKGNFLVRRLQRLPFVFNIRIEAPFRGLIDSAQSFYDPKRLVGRNLPALIEEQNKRAAEAAGSPPPVQPPASRKVP